MDAGGCIGTEKGLPVLLDPVDDMCKARAKSSILFTDPQRYEVSAEPLDVTCWLTTLKKDNV